jgi:hypothetical protein
VRKGSAAAPALAPESNGSAGEAEGLGDGFEARLVGEVKQDVDAARQADGSGLALLDLQEQGALPGREFEGGKMRGAHGSIPGSGRWVIFYRAVLWTWSLVG